MPEFITLLTGIIALMNAKTDITIAGGGIAGLLTAREFLQAGCTVTLLDKQAIGLESSWAGGGILLPLYPWHHTPAVTQLALASRAYYPALAEQLHRSTGIDPEWLPCGLLMTPVEECERALAWCTQHQLPAEIADAQRLALFPIATPDALWLPDVAQIRNPRLIKALQADLLQCGARIVEFCELYGTRVQHQRIHAIETSRGTFEIEQLVLCTGAWSGELWQQLFSPLGPRHGHLPIHPVKGQMLLFEATPGLLPHMVITGDYYLIPRRDGKILAGSTVEQSGFDKTTTEEAYDALADMAQRMFPPLRDAPIIGHWAGLRPSSPQGIPYIGCHPNLNNLGINAGHFRNGLVMGPAAARLIVDLILQRPPHIDPSPYQLDAPRD